MVSTMEEQHFDPIASNQWDKIGRHTELYIWNRFELIFATS